MRIGIYGLGHLGQVTTACLAKLGCEVIAFGNMVYIAEKNVYKYIHENYERVVITEDIEKFKDLDYVWVTMDTPVEGEDKANVQEVYKKIKILTCFINEKTPIIISSQLPLGTVSKLEKEFPDHIFAYSPENLRHGTAVDNFLNPDRIVIGVRNEEHKKLLEPLFKKITKNLVWMSVEEAEMVKHAINSFLATCITWANEFGDICREEGIDYEEVLRGIQSEQRIGNKLPLKTGKAYSGKTLARDVKYLIDMSDNKFFKTVRDLNNRRLKNDKL